MRTAFLNTITSLMEQHEEIVTITADMGFSVFEELQKKFPTKFINTGVTEQSSMSIAAGLALSGHVVYFYAQAPFATMRCLEQIRLDVAYHKLNVKIIGVASGFYSNQLGVSHFALEDLGLMRLLPNMTVIAPGDPYETEKAVELSYKQQGPFYIRLTKSGSVKVHIENKPSFIIGKGIKVFNGKEVVIFTTGSLLPEMVEVVKKLQLMMIFPSLYSIHTVKPIDKELIIKEAKKSSAIITVEDHNITGGLGTSIAEVLSEANVEHKKFLRIGVNDVFTSVVGSTEFLLDYNGLSVPKIIKKLVSFLK